MILDGKALAATVRAEVKTRVEALRTRNVVPGLAVVRVGEDPASVVYVKSKRKAAEEVGIYSEEHVLPATTRRDELLGLIGKLNGNGRVHAILCQLPLPEHLDEDEVVNAIDPRKDVDGLHPQNIGLLALGKRGPRACTPLGVMRILREFGVDPAGKRALVIGRSILVGKPMALMLLEANATVTMAHSKTRDLGEEIGRADIVVAAVGRAQIVKGAWVKEGATVVDVGMNRNAEGKLCGDVEFGEAAKRAANITPVPGGVGLLTVAMLVSNAAMLAEGSR
jgi:methylenetetrahydrofolate dehydrogenase (NADP+)/methenyltetrahydrofolate cyclohydrolase